MAPSTLDYDPKPRRSPRIPFTPPGSDKQCETAVFIYGNLNATPRAPLICIHGGPGAGSILFVPLAAELQRRHNIPVILYDQLSCGDSTHLRETEGDTNFWTMELFLAELQNLIDRLGLKEYDLLGHSWGGMISGAFALTQPRGLRKLICYSTPVAVSLREEAARKQRDGLPSHHREVLLEGEKNGMLNIHFDMSSPECQAAQHELSKRHLCRLSPWPKEIDDTMTLCADDETTVATMWGGTTTSHTGPIKDFDLRPRLEEITEGTVPGGILVINGRHDFVSVETSEPYMTLTTKLEERRKRWVMFEESSHVANLEEPEKFYDVLGSFLVDQ